MSDARRRRLALVCLAAALGLPARGHRARQRVVAVRWRRGAVLQKAGLPGGDASALGPTGEAILWSVRLPRVLLAALVGGGLAVVGAALQAVFRNPMADSGLLGVGAGAALGAVLAVTSGWATNVFLALPLAAFAGAMAAVLAVYVLAHAVGPARRRTACCSPGSRLRAGRRGHVGAARGHRGVPGEDRALLAGRRPRGPRLERTCRRGAAFVLAGVAAPRSRWRARSTCSRSARTRRPSLGLPVHARASRSSAWPRSWPAPATAVAGSVPFVGLVAPHALRPLVGPLAPPPAARGLPGRRDPGRAGRPRRADAERRASTCPWAR